MNPFLSEMGLAPETLALLADYGIHTMRDLRVAMTEGRMATFLTKDQRIALIEDVWAWIRCQFRPASEDVPSSLRAIDEESH